MKIHRFYSYEDYKNLDVNSLLRAVEESLQYLSGENYENK